MTCFKILNTDGDVVDAEAAETPAFVMWQQEHETLLLCRERDAQAIVSSKDNETVYPLEGKTLPVPTGGCIARKVSLAEYVEYIQQQGEEETDEISDAEALAIIMGVTNS